MEVDSPVAVVLLTWMVVLPPTLEAAGGEAY